MQLRHYLPKEYEILSIDTECLPFGDHSVFHPFLSLVLNINVVTTGYRDGNDGPFCLILTIGDFQGGALCLVEPGLVIPLGNGDLLVFKSAEIMHFNLHYVGSRASLTLKTDRAFKTWVTNHNGWQNNGFFNV